MTSPQLTQYTSSKQEFYAAAELRWSELYAAWSDYMAKYQDCQAKSIDLRRTKSDLLASGNRQPEAVFLQEMALLEVLPVHDSNGKELSVAKRTQLLEAAKAASKTYRAVIAESSTAAWEMATLQQQQDILLKQMRGVEMALDFIRASLDFFRR